MTSIANHAGRYVVRVRTKAGTKRVEAAIKPATYGELLRLVAEALGAAGPALSSSTGAAAAADEVAMTLRVGFPPTPCLIARGDPNPVRHGEMIAVTIGVASPNKKAAPAKSRKRKATAQKKTMVKEKNKKKNITKIRKLN